MSFIYSRALVEASLPANFEATDVSAPSSENPTLKPSLWHDKTMAPSRLSRFGMTCATLTDDRGAELLKSWLVAFRAKTLAQPEPATGSTVSAADSGLKWRGSFAKYDPSESKWKTAQCSLLGDSEEFSETWPRWGSMRNGESFLRPIPALPICASASGLWQTPVADDAIERTAGKWNSRGEPKLSAEAKLWPTPTRSDGMGGPGHSGRAGGLNLRTAVKSWPTPCASASKGSSPAALTRKSGKDRSNDRIDHAVMALDGGQLNPEWVEWLMGWPIGHTALEPLETARYQEWLQQHSPYSRAAE